MIHGLTFKEYIEEEKEKSAEKEPPTYFQAVDIGDVIYNNVQDWIQSQSKKGKGRTGVHLNDAFDDLVNKYGLNVWICDKLTFKFPRTWNIRYDIRSL